VRKETLLAGTLFVSELSLLVKKPINGITVFEI
jgi:hypothetical protein